VQQLRIDLILFIVCSCCLFRCLLKNINNICAPLYCTHLWYNYSQTVMNKFKSVYHNLCKRFCDCSKYDSTCLICTVFNIPSCQSAIRASIFSFMKRLELSTNPNICCILQSSWLYTSRLRLHWWSELLVNFCK